ncbi:PIN domain-containing protein [Acidipropionibacterium thoenii]|uniref:PIN domain-containing protein n=1 Tax=Acidipropionibacterium thoenii TaxID=1751 RepID=UPI00048980F4|nr:PIN domain-containing protein [Acidipropionibacterium thoenii]
MTFSAFLDTCVLVPSVLRDLLLELGTSPAYRPLWSDKIEEELATVIRRRHRERGRDADETEAYITRLRRNMNAALPDARVKDWEALAGQITGAPDPGDIHVIAAGALGHADVIVTFNLKHFPERILPGSLFAQSPDDFLRDLFGLYPRQVLLGLNKISSRTGQKGPRWTVDDILARLEKNGVRGFVADVREEHQQDCDDL